MQVLYFSEVVAVMPGFINLKLSEGFLADYMNGMAADEKLGLGEPEKERDHYRRLWRCQCGKTSSCRTFAFCSYR